MTDAVPASKLRRAARIGGRVLSTVLTALLAVGAVALATGTIETRASQAPAPEAAPPATVSAAPLTVQPGYSVTRHFVGQVEPQQRIDVAFEAGGTVAEIVVAEGDRVAEGALLARLDTRALEADRRSVLAAQAALMAQLELAERTAERAEGLGESGFASQQRLDEARLAVAELTARVAETTARLEVIDVALDKAVLRAPFSGEIGARAADPGQTLAAGAAVLTLLQDGAAELHIGLPPALAATLEPGLEVESTVAGQTQMAVLDQLQPDLDPATRTQTAIFRLTGTAAFGQAGRITLRQEVADPGAWVPLSALRPGLGDTWTVLGVAGDRILPIAVEVLHAEETRVFLRGGFAAADHVVRNGTHLFVPGQTVALAE